MIFTFFIYGPSGLYLSAYQYFILTSEILILTTKNIFLSLILFPAACPCLKDIVSQILVMMFGVLKVISFELSQFPTKYVIYVGLGCSPWNCRLSSASLSFLEDWNNSNSSSPPVCISPRSSHRGQHLSEFWFCHSLF